MQCSPGLGLPPWLCFRKPLQILHATRIDEVADALRALESALAQGRWVAGFLSYEAAPAFDPALSTHAPGPLPLLWFGVYEGPIAASAPPTPERIQAIEGKR